MRRVRWFKWVRTEAESATLQREGARICEASLDTHHAEYAVLHEIPPHIAESMLAGTWRPA